MNGSINHLTNLVWKYIFNQLSIFIKPEAAYGGGGQRHPHPGKLGDLPPSWKIGGTFPPLKKFGAQEERTGTFF